MAAHTYLAPAKINWFLHITGRRADGYHTLETVFQRIDWCDELTIQTTDDGVITLTGDLSGVAMTANLAYRAAVALRDRAELPKGHSLGARIHLAKNIPMGAGLGGGSSNAATVLTALNDLWGLDFANQTLQKIGLTLGADVPFFVSDFNAAFATGVGEVLTPIDLPARELFLVNPNVHVPTAQVFSGFRRFGFTPSLDVSLSELPDLLPNHQVFSNDLEKSTFEIAPAVAHVYEVLSAAMPDGFVRMSGSGATVFAMPMDGAQRQVLDDWRQVCPPDWQCRWVSTASLF
ncbi:4-diphosphocytidyl-2-C-methyl-D-erythritol kinase [Formosimonas limnophila]|uniref:4-diphosphocytidyl-2-C-methyl-D-erythritol kinase n=1 Tax=Formosimonas limnophila TaxID=1384487 RepID=A0A8J3CMU3_9BURK|nr:4-(cytidine 5'-diphospho)-2-C-methyl-D-erythritol kinase [Formosimonas limnophila]GHA72269.1 4-diphosphocytidyl-2-C-methyl-D-erythritol kinase [Formosimonas limnophila]